MSKENIIFIFMILRAVALIVFSVMKLKEAKKGQDDKKMEGG